MKFPVYILATPGAAPNQYERFVPRDWKGDLIDELFEAQVFLSPAAAARRLDELMRINVRSDIRALTIFQISGVSAQKLSPQDNAFARDQALDEDMRNKMNPDVAEYFNRNYVRR